MKKIIFKFFYTYPKFISFIAASITYLFYFNYLKKKKNSKYNFLVLNYKRFNIDLNILNEDDDFQFFYINERIIYILLAPYTFYIKESLKNNRWWEIQNSSEYNKFLELGGIFFYNYLKNLSKIIKINFIITPAYYYFQDQLFEKSSQKLNLKYIVINKENIIDKENIDRKTNTNLKKNIIYGGSFIITQNDLERKSIINSKVAISKKVLALGSPRFDKLYQISKKNSLDPKGNAFTLFSFRHSIGGYQLKDKSNTSGFSKLKDDGAQQYFYNVHNTIMQLASENENIIFYIKTKFSDGWIQEIKLIKNSFEQKHQIILHNVVITSSIPAQELIIKSKIVSGINTTALIEARILGRLVIIPIFDEVKERMNQNVFFKNYFGKEFVVLKSVKEYLSFVNLNIRKKFVYHKIIDENILNSTLNFDKKNYFRYNDFFKSII